MNDPHVEKIIYRLEQIESVAYDAPALSIATPDFDGILINGELTLRPKHHYATAPEAKIVADKFVQAWRIEVGLEHCRDDFRFRYSDCVLIDRRPMPGSMPIHQAAISVLQGDLKPKIKRTIYPPPPTDFQATPEVEDLWERYNQYTRQRETLLGMAYYCLTVLERKGGRQQAGSSYNIDVDVLNKVGELSSARGDSLTARKAKGTANRLNAAEHHWIEEAIKALIRHLATPGVTKLTMSQLPRL